jgi:hypothetical protein
VPIDYYRTYVVAIGAAGSDSLAGDIAGQFHPDIPFG